VPSEINNQQRVHFFFVFAQPGPTAVRAGRILLANGTVTSLNRTKRVRGLGAQRSPAYGMASTFVNPPALRALVVPDATASPK